MLDNLNRIHFVGIGGAGMSAIAKVLLAKGFAVSGSDIAKSETIHRLQQLGANIIIGHDAANIDGAEAIVVSTAIAGSNPEIAAAKTQGLPIYHRSEMVAALMDERRGIAVAGAHGKTTTTSMIALMLEKTGLDPTIIIGGDIDYLNGNAKLGGGEWLVAEADESDASFLKLNPEVAVVTNIENDHMDHYGTMDNILAAFTAFIGKLPADNGLAVLCFDNRYIRDIAPNCGRKYISYALDGEADYTAENIETRGMTTTYLACHHGRPLGTVVINVPGRHNVANSLAAVVVGIHAGLAFEQVAAGLGHFQGVKRRFQTKGRVSGVWIVDDYAHHPTEIATTLEAARDVNPKRLICVFQPHRYTRTKFLRQEFGGAFTRADLLILTDIYSAGEAPIPGISGETLKEEVERQTDKPVTYIADKANIARYLSEIVEPGDLVMTMGAGNIYLSGEELVDRLAHKNN
ncbi:MAG: UDP-N-acetylmuramate--L-alanine ligase [Sporomusaceae bacterium]|nr:UDP-N-acetylmuramate--L-alanine ligase [Sporomusaceae bacterium]